MKLPQTHKDKVRAVELAQAPNESLNACVTMSDNLCAPWGAKVINHTCARGKVGIQIVCLWDRHS